MGYYVCGTVSGECTLELLICKSYQNVNVDEEHIDEDGELTVCTDNLVEELCPDLCETLDQRGYDTTLTFFEKNEDGTFDFDIEVSVVVECDYTSEKEDWKYTSISDDMWDFSRHASRFMNEFDVEPTDGSSCILDEYSNDVKSLTVQSTRLVGEGEDGDQFDENV